MLQSTDTAMHRTHAMRTATTPALITNQCAGVCLSSDPTGVVTTLLNGGAHPNATAANIATPLHTAAACGNSRAISALHAHSEDLNPHAILPQSRFTPLHLAVASADDDTVASMLSLGSAVDSTAHKAIQPLHIAAFVGQPAIVKRLLDAGADATVPMETGQTPLHLACEKRNFEVMEGVMSVLSVVDWLGDIRIKPQLMQALALSVEEEHVSSGSGTLQRDSCLLKDAAAIKLSRTSQGAEMRNSVHLGNTPAATSDTQVNGRAAPTEKLEEPPTGAKGCFAVRTPLLW